MTDLATLIGKCAEEAEQVHGSGCFCSVTYDCRGCLALRARLKVALADLVKSQMEPPLRVKQAAHCGETWAIELVEWYLEQRAAALKHLEE